MIVKINETYIATKNFKVLGYLGETNALTATQKADELTAIINDLNAILETRLNGGADNG